LVTSHDTGDHFFAEYEGMIVANAACVDCEAEYLVWIDGSGRCGGSRWPGRPLAEESHSDLSFRSTFNDEPGERDKPRWAVVRVAVPRGQEDAIQEAAARLRAPTPAPEQDTETGPS